MGLCYSSNHFRLLPTIIPDLKSSQVKAPLSWRNRKQATYHLPHHPHPPTQKKKKNVFTVKKNVCFRFLHFLRVPYHRRRYHGIFISRCTSGGPKASQCTLEGQTPVNSWLKLGSVVSSRDVYMSLKKKIYIYIYTYI